MVGCFHADCLIVLSAGALSGCASYSLIIIMHFRCVAYGVLPDEEAEKLNKVLIKRKKEMRGGVASPSPAKKKKTKARVIKEEVDDVDMQVSGADRVGSAVI